MSDRFGFWSATAAATASIAYGVPQLMQVAGMLPPIVDRILIFAPSLALAPAYVATMVAVAGFAPRHRKLWGHAALAFAIMYATLVSLVYVVQLGVVIPHELHGEIDRFALISCCEPGAFLTAVDLLGYTLMSLSTLFAAPVFPAEGFQRWPRRALFANGALAPFLLLQLALPSLIYVGALWLITFPASMILLAILFARLSRRASEHRAENLNRVNP